MTTYDNTRHSVLVVDSDPLVHETTSAVLGRRFDVHHTRDPQVALELLRKHTFQVVIAEWMLPVMDGIAFFRFVGKLPLSVSCLLISVRIDELASEVAWEDRKSLGVLKKPLDHGQLLERVEHLARLGEMKQSIRKLRGSRLPA